jgi:RNA polymerase sigma factor (sigma-70 family)
MSMSDAELLESYVRDGADSAFATLADRYLDLVYSVACRHVGPSLAEDVTQSVFVELARHARDIKAGTPLIAWLHVVSRRLAINASRDAARRVSREQQAAVIASMKPESSDWRAVEPLLDEAVESLAEPDRTAILLRFFQNKSLRDVGTALGTSDDAAQKRVTRALDQLRAFFLRRGITLTAAGLVSDLGANALINAPAGLLAAVTTSSSFLTASTATVAMSTLQKSALLLVLALVAGFGAYEFSVARRQRDERSPLAVPRAVARASEQVPVTRISPPAAASGAGVGDTASQRVTVLKQLLAELPAQRLPEIRLLAIDDWLAIARKHELDSAADIRVALAELRAMARRNFATALQDALRRYAAASDGGWPDDIAHLVPFLTPPADAEMLMRYEMTHSHHVGDTAQKLIREKATSDLILTVGPDGWGITNNANFPTGLGESDTDAVNRAMQALSAATEDGVDDQSKRAASLAAFAASIGEAMKTLGPNYGDEMKRAATAFVAAHPNETIADIAQVLPFLEDAEKLIAAFRPVFAKLDYAREHDGEMPASPEQLRPYLVRPFFPADAFRAMKLKRDGDDLDLDFPFPSEPSAKL